MELMEIEKELAGPDGAAAMKRYDDVLVALGDRLKKVLDQGVTPDEYPRCAALADVVVVARKLLRLQMRG